jgi:feruloyl esterase
MITALVAAQLAAGLVMPCEDLRNATLERATVTSAEAVPAGPFRGGGRGGAGAGRRGGGPPGAAAQPPPPPLPEHCRVQLVLEPSSDSNIKVDLWMPLERWNGKLLAVGTGGWAGSIQGYGDMQDALRRGYATVATDTGHSAADGANGMFALGHPEKVVDFAYRAVHDMTEKSKRLIDVFYERPLDYSYFKGCSTGGRQAVMAAQRFPGDFDGIIAGALANRHVQMHTAQVAAEIELSRRPELAISAEKAKLENDALMAQCDTLGDGYVNNPRQCTFDPATLACGAGVASGQCLSPNELESVKKYYDGTRLENGELVFSGQALGNALPALAGTNEAPGAFLFDTIRILGFQNPDYDWQMFDLDHDLPRIIAAAGFIDAVDPDLRAFKAHGGKLLMYAGWVDTAITPENTVLYHESVLEEMGGDQDEWMRLFMVPGMAHCGGGPGPNTFDTIAALERWREQDQAPSAIAARNPQSGLERPLCPYPSYARYDGSGDTKDAANFTCAAP